MTITARKGNLINEPCDVLVIGAYLHDKDKTIFPFSLGEDINAYLEQVCAEDHFVAKEGSTILIRMNDRALAKRILVVGLGKADEFTSSTIRRCAAHVQQMIAGLEPKQVMVHLFGLDRADLDIGNSVQAFVEGLRLAEYTYGRYKKVAKKEQTLSLACLFEDAAMVRKAQTAIEHAELTSQATMVARDLVNTPAYHLAPKDLVDAAKAIVGKTPGLKIKVFAKESLKKMGAGGLLAVNQGSDHEPFLVHLTYTPKKKFKKSIALVGKAVTFDSGGLSLKPADGMMTMKIDMSGAAAVLGVFSVLTKLQPNIQVHGIFGAVENMPSGKAIRPGDIVTAMNGKTIEILNTDAEGRVTLADTLTYACKLKPDAVIDLATLTGACMVALGEEVTGLMSNNPELAQRVLASASEVGESMWELPLYKGYRSLILSDLADVKNIGGRYGGALTAGLFLQEFVEPNMPWVHLDIAGPAFAERPFGPYEQKGATGHPVRTLIHFLRSF